jgi:hypothetical protein
MIGMVGGEVKDNVPEPWRMTVMPLYTFRCCNCGKEEEVLSPMDADVRFGDILSVHKDGTVPVRDCLCGYQSWQKVFSGAHAFTPARWR